MAIHSLISLSDNTATRLVPLGIHSGMDITIQNANSSGYIYIGGESVTSSNYGYRIMPNHAISFELPGVDSLYAVASEDGMSAAILRTNLEIGV
jgi:hypothetical protein